MHINIAANSVIVIDYKTDSIIQSSLRHELPADVTVITVAHRLQTIMDADKIVRSSSFLHLTFAYPTLDGFRCREHCMFSDFRHSYCLYFRQVEFDSPQELLKLPNGKLRSLVDESGDKDFLYDMAKGQDKDE